MTSRKPRMSQNNRNPVIRLQNGQLVVDATGPLLILREGVATPGYIYSWTASGTHNNDSATTAGAIFSRSTPWWTTSGTRNNDSATTAGALTQVTIQWRMQELKRGGSRLWAAEAAAA